ncbi:LuxR C-terminal-related transcriptional regulator [Streptomyces sp. NPDC001222]|uniref:helix-turn-helix transcriptional regulator n=1 Tax=Streptomyces sp. NPDC001222 TaxID=3364548 RepID=UPI00369F2240
MTSTQPGTVPLDVIDLDRVLRVVEECGAAATLEVFREAVLDSLRRHLGYRHVTFFVGASLPGVFLDSAPVAAGRARRMLPSYVEYFHQLDPFALACRRRPSAGPAPIPMSACVGARAAEHDDYLDRFLFRHGIYDKVLVPLRSRAGACAGIGLLAENSGAFTAHDLAIVSALAPHLANLFALHVRTASPRPPGWARLTPRQRQTARMAAQGASNEQIATALHVTVDTVKKHLTAAYAALGCTRRSQLAALWNDLGGGTCQ